MRERELKEEMERYDQIKKEIKIKIAKLRSTIPSGGSVRLTDDRINFVVQNEAFLPMVNDDVEEFIRLSAESGFNPNAKIGGFSYIQLMAVFESINCLTHAISTNLYSLNNTASFALTGGNMGIIHILENTHKLEQERVSFDNTLENATNCSYDLFKWKVEHWKEDNILSACKECLRKGMWHYALYFVKTGDVKPGDLLIDACEYGSCFFVKNLVEKCNYKPGTKEANAALIKASSEGRLDIVKYLVETGKCDVDAKDKFGWTALHAASWQGHLDIVKCLVEKGATITEKSIEDADTQEIKNYLLEQQKEQKRNQNQ